MAMDPRLRKLTVTIHVATSVGLLGSISAFLALAITAIATLNVAVLSACYIAMDLTTRYVVVPLAMAALLTGVIQSLGTAWGLFQHYWVVIKLLVTTFAITILFIKTGLISEAAQLAMQTPLLRTELDGLGVQLVLHSAAGLLVLLVPMVLSIYKPSGKTAYGWRKEKRRQG